MNYRHYLQAWRDPSVKRYVCSLRGLKGVKGLYNILSAAAFGRRRMIPKGLEVEPMSLCQWQRAEGAWNEVFSAKSIQRQDSKDAFMELATGKWLFQDGEVDWSKEYQDREDSMSLHRFGWIVRIAASGYSVPWSIIDSWITWVGSKKNDLLPDWVMDSYTVSERICNISVLLTLDPPKDKDIIRRVLESINQDSIYLSKNLDYYGYLNTNNHILNNARALILAGTLLGNDDCFSIGLKLLKEQLPLHCSSDGVFREASSHYQLVITRWMVEIGMVLKEKKDPYAEEFVNHLLKMLDRCDDFSFFGEDHCHLPLIGDISPDYPPSWYIGMAGAARKLLTGHNEEIGSRSIAENPSLKNLFGFEGAMTPLNQPKSWVSEGGDWMRLEGVNWSVLSHADTDISDSRTTHGHQDILSFEMGWRGMPVIIDRGRRDYNSTVDSEESAILDEWHNSVLIDESRIGFRPRSFMSSEWLSRNRTRAEFKNEDDDCVLTLSKPSGPIIFDVHTIKRTWHIEPNSADIRTTIAGKGHYAIQLFLHIPESTIKLDTENGLLLVLGNGNQFSMRWNDLPSPIILEAERYPSYGNAETCKRLEWKCEVKLPWECVITLTSSNKVNKKIECSKIL